MWNFKLGNEKFELKIWGLGFKKNLKFELEFLSLICSKRFFFPFFFFFWKFDFWFFSFHDVIFFFFRVEKKKAIKRKEKERKKGKKKLGSWLNNSAGSFMWGLNSSPPFAFLSLLFLFFFASSSLIFSSTINTIHPLLGLDVVFHGGESQNFVGSPLTL